MPEQVLENGGQVQITSRRRFLAATGAAMATLWLTSCQLPGHGAVGDGPDWIGYRYMPMTIHKRVAALKRQGRTMDEVIAAAPTADYDVKWCTRVIDGKTFASRIYAVL